VSKAGVRGLQIDIGIKNNKKNLPEIDTSHITDSATIQIGS